MEVESVSLGNLSPTEIVALHSYGWDIHGQLKGVDPVADLLEAKTGWPVYDWVTTEVSKLAETDVPRLEAISTAFADSQSAEDRKELSLQTISVLTKVSPTLGVNLWQRLLRDPDPEVRDQAHRTLGDVTSGNFTGNEQYREATGMTRAETALLLEAYRDAEQGNNIFYLGDVALRRVLGISET